MDSNELERTGPAALVYKLPRLRGAEWPAAIVETSQFLILALWSGLLLTAAVIVPIFAWKLLPALEATRFLSQFSGFTNLLGSGVGAFLLVTGLLQHTLELRRPRVVIIQMILYLLMTITLVVCQILLVGEIESVLRQIQTSEASTAGLLAKAPSLQHGVQWLHGFTFLLAMAAIAVGWRPRVQVKHQMGTVKVFKLEG